jgi:hypothetical protein
MGAAILPARERTHWSGRRALQITTKPFVSLNREGLRSSMMM